MKCSKMKSGLSKLRKTTQILLLSLKTRSLRNEKLFPSQNQLQTKKLYTLNVEQQHHTRENRFTKGRKRDYGRWWWTVPLRWGERRLCGLLTVVKCGVGANSWWRESSERNRDKHGWWFVDVSLLFFWSETFVCSRSVFFLLSFFYFAEFS